MATVEGIAGAAHRKVVITIDFDEKSEEAVKDTIRQLMQHLEHVAPEHDINVDFMKKSN